MEIDGDGLHSVAAVRQDKLHRPSATRPGQAERGGRLSVEGGADHIDGMGNTAGSAHPDLGPVGKATRGPLRNTKKQTAPHLRVPDPGPGSMESKRDGDILEGNLRVRLPPLGYPGSGTTEGTGGPGGTDPDSPSLAGEALVPHPTRHAHRPAGATPPNPQTAGTETLWGEARQPRPSKSSGMETIRQSSRKQGFTEGVAKRIANNVRGSSSTVYEGKMEILFSLGQVPRSETC